MYKEYVFLPFEEVEKSVVVAFEDELWFLAKISLI